MEIDVKQEVANLIASKDALDKKLTDAVVGKWVLCVNTNRYIRSSIYAKTKSGEFICFKVDKAHFKSTKLSSEDFGNELVLMGLDSRGQIRHLTVQRVGYTPNPKYPMTTRTKGEEIDKSVYNYNLTTFNSEEEALLYAEIHEQLNPGKGDPF